MAINVGTPPDLTEAVDRIADTMRAVFPAVQVSRYDEFNSVVDRLRRPGRRGRRASTPAPPPLVAPPPRTTSRAP